MSDWRRIDIDAYEPDKFLSKEELVPDLPETPYSEIQKVSQQSRTYLSSGKFSEALALVLDTPPYVSDEQTKETHTETVFEVLCSIRNNHQVGELKSFIQSLTLDQQDVLVKYLYKTMGKSYGAKQGGLLLNWFEKVVEVSGEGPIVRYLADRRTV
ncbi:uncharacterized protein KQ657_001491 [Scheffersomyces spartinae]|uniref:Actin-related protein 2/3 complex subunit 5 n=1 Tax=Scheffersomyces spartinae TaxID=45513 RepID=A0A9P7V7V5_9ASCO|nr:uncharacterized protein KQ657_001491 [Scheffersomyces spartinae]KAG7192708.1 hypothetical protein KQ657_001491 [Scheffersomyces spartinae]